VTITATSAHDPHPRSTPAPDPGQPTSASASESSPAGWVRLRMSLGRHAYAALGLPVSLLGLVAAPLGAAHRVERWQGTLAARLLGVPTRGAPPSAVRARRRVFAHALVGLPVNLVAFALVVPAWAVFLTRGVAYPLFGADHLDQSWGGPTLAGAWFVHFIQGPPLLALVTLVLTPVSKLQARLAQRCCRQR